MKKVFSCRALYTCLIFSGLLVSIPFPLHARQNTPSPTYTIQLVTVPDKAMADTELGKISRRGHDAYIVEYTTETGKVIYKLRSGKFTSRADAVAAADRYTEQEGGSVLIVAQLAPAGQTAEPAAEPAVEDDAGAAEKKEGAADTGESADATGKTVGAAVQKETKSSPPNSLVEKINALKRGEVPPGKKAKPRMKPEDEIWFTIQTSTELDSRSAERRISKLRDKGYDAYCTEVTQNSRRLYKIRFGRFTLAREARRAAQSYTEQERRNCLVVKIADGVDVAPSPARGTAPKKQSQAQDTGPLPQIHKKTKTIPAATDPAQQDKKPQEPEELHAKTGIGQPEQTQAAAEDEQAPQETVHEAGIPAEPDAPAENQAAPEKKPEVEPPPEDSYHEQTPPSREEVPAAKKPERMTSIYAYRQKSGALNLTNRYEDVPEELRKNIDYISLFPARVKDIAENGRRVTLECQDERKEIFLAGLTISGPGEAARAYLKALGDEPLRLKYNPWMDTKDGAIPGRLYRKEGAYINLDMVRKGLGRCDMTTLAPDQQEAFRKAQDAARREGAGIWR